MDGKWDAIIDKQIFDDVQGKLSTNKKMKYKATHDFIFSGRRRKVYRGQKEAGYGYPTALRATLCPSVWVRVVFDWYPEEDLNLHAEAPDPKSGVSTNSTIRVRVRLLSSIKGYFDKLFPQKADCYAIFCDWRQNSGLTMYGYLRK